MKPTRCFLFFLVIAFWTASHGTALAFNGLLPMSNRPSAKEFALKDPEGRLHTLSQYRGQVVLVNFWATWCPPCLKEMPSMERLWKELGGKGLVILAVNIGESADNVEYFGFSHNLTFPLLLDQNDSSSRAWLVRGLPTSYVLDSQGRIVYQAIGERDWDDPGLKKVIAELIQEGKQP
ncbi:MAG: TlpA family protein disulfide reductase [Magnetococcus sp. YQC-3]